MTDGLVGRDGTVLRAEDLERAMHELRGHALGLAQAWQALRRAGWSAAQVRPVQSATRSLQRGCERLRLAALQRRASDLELKLVAIGGDRAPSEGEMVALEAALSALSSSALALDLNGAVHGLSLFHAANDARGEAEPREREMLPRTIALLRANDDLARGMAEAIRERGYAIVELTTPQQMAEWLRRHLPYGAIVDARYLHALSRQLGALKAHEGSHEIDAIVVVVSNRRDLGRKLLAMRNGARAYFEEPLDALEVLASLGLNTPNVVAPATRRALILCAERREGLEWGRWLTDLSISSRVETDLALIEPLLVELDPHLLVIDRRHASGADLKLIEALKAQARWQRLVVISVGGVAELAHRERAIAAGADEYLLAPVKSRHLLSVARARLARADRAFLIEPGGAAHGQMSRRQLIERCAAIGPDPRASLLLVATDQAESLGNSLGVLALGELDLQLADLIRRCADPGDAFAPFQDGALLMLTQRDEASAALEVAERIRMSCEETRFRAGNKVCDLRVSVGLARLAEAECAEGALKNARAALAAAQRLGGNRSLWYESQRASVSQQQRRTPEADAVAVMLDWHQAEVQLLFQPLLPLAGRLTGQFLVLPRFALGGGAVAGYAAMLAAARRRDDGLAFDRALVEQVLDARHRALKRGRQTRLLLPLAADLLGDGALPGWIKQQLEARKLAGPGLSLAFTAEDVAERSESYVALAETIRPLGIRVGITRVGADPSLVHRIRGLPADFVLLHEGQLEAIDLHPGQKDVSFATLLRRIREAGSVCVATGVERLAQLEALKALRVDYALSEALGPAQQQIDYDFNKLLGPKA